MVDDFRENLIINRYDPCFGGRILAKYLAMHGPAGHILKKFSLPTARLNGLPRKNYTSRERIRRNDLRSRCEGGRRMTHP